LVQRLPLQPVDGLTKNFSLTGVLCIVFSPSYLWERLSNTWSL
jgi:hypothetical protein